MQSIMEWVRACCCKTSGHGSHYKSVKEDGAERFHTKYECFELLGVGKTGKVVRVRARQPPNEDGAAKVVLKAYLNTPERQYAFREELKILQQIRHPHVLRLYEIFEDPVQFYIVTERAQGGELMDIVCHPNTQFSERDVAHIIYQLLTVVKYLHDHGITHRDIKVDNILCRTSCLDDGIVLIDFGLSHIGRKGGMDMQGMNGTCHYMAPEMFQRNGRYGCEIDLWAIGVVTYVLLFGNFPFDGRFMSQIEDQITAGEYVIPSELLHSVSTHAIRFVQRLLVVNRKLRLSAEEALNHPWLQQIDENVSSQSFNESHLENHREMRQSTKALKASQQERSSIPLLNGST